MLIRPERREDAALIHELVETAFKSAKVSSGTEEALVARVRAGRAYLPDLALVAEEDGRLLGQVMISRVPLRKDGRTNSVLLVAPLSVRLERRGEGIGSALMRAGLARGPSWVTKRFFWWATRNIMGASASNPSRVWV